LLDFDIHQKQNEKQSRESTRVKAMNAHSMVSCDRLMQ
jgi:hypothetical protein